MPHRGEHQQPHEPQDQRGRDVPPALTGTVRVRASIHHGHGRNAPRNHADESDLEEILLVDTEFLDMMRAIHMRAPTFSRITLLGTSKMK